jgi:maltose O-acetyltransferase
MGLKIGADVSIQDGVFFDPSHCYLISIGARTVLAPNVRLIAHDASTKRFVGATRLGKIVIEEECFIGDSVIVLSGVTIGRGSIIGAGSVVTRSIPAGCVATGNPATVIASVDDYSKRQTEQSAGGKTFSSDYWIGRTDERQREEMLLAATAGKAFIV